MSDQRAVLVVDDEADRLAPLAEAVRETVGDEVDVRAWQPNRDEDPLERFDDEARRGLALIVTDDDLTKSGLGLLGSAITTWAQDRFIPVCNFSRKPVRRLPREHNFFELRVPLEPSDSARAAFIARIYTGFEQVRRFIGAAEEGRPTARLLAGAMGVPELEDDVAPFLASAASASAAFMRTVVATGAEDVQRPSESDRVALLTFVLGHVLVNAVLEFPGPILSRPTLAAYCAVSPSTVDALAERFTAAGYDGPFSAPGRFFQRRLVDREIDAIASGLPGAPEESDQYNRAAVAAALGGVDDHDCTRCGGVRGGYWCPFTRRPVCNRTDCSVTSEAWIPRGATLCRVERDYFDEVAPLLGE